MALSAAVFSPCFQYRYRLQRVLTNNGRTILFIGLNPSTADAENDDPTVRRLIGFTRSMGYGQMLLGNLFAYRSTDPKNMLAQEDPAGPDNFTHISSMFGFASTTVICWGAGGVHRDASAQLVARLRATDPRMTLYCFGKTKSGQPLHPLYLAGDTPLVPYGGEDTFEEFTPVTAGAEMEEF